jgi:hypothetical protein
MPRQLPANARHTAREKSLSLTVRFGSCQRYTETDGKLSRRSIRFRDCPILNCGLKGEDHPARGDEIELVNREPSVIGEAEEICRDELARTPYRDAKRAEHLATQNR